MRGLLGGLALSLALICMPGSAGLAAGPGQPDWERLPLVENVVRIDTPASRALFVRTLDGLLRSDNGGMTWSDVPLPPPLSLGRPIRDAVVVDPSDQQALFAAGRDGVYRSLGEPVTWSLSLPLPTLSVLRITVSPVDSSIVYAAAAQGSAGFQIWRSDDRGGTWSRIQGPLNGAVCGWVIPVLDAHLSDPNQIFGSWRCHAGRELFGGGLLRLSTIRGATWMDVFRRSAHFPEKVIGGASADPYRAYMVANRGAEPGGGFVARSDDGGINWSDIFLQASGSSLGDIAMDPANPDILFLTPAGTPGTVLVTRDAGATWAPLSPTFIGPARALALGADGAHLYAGSGNTLWRHRLPG